MSDTLNQAEQMLPEEGVLLEEELPPEEVLPEGELPPEEDGEGQEEVKNWLERTEQITIEDIKSALPEQDYDTLTLGQEQNGIRCLIIAKLRTKADIQSTGHQYDEAVPEVRLALLKMFIYELFAFVGESQKAEAAYQDYALIIKTSFGDIKTKTDVAEDGGAAVAAMKVPARWSRYGR